MSAGLLTALNAVLRPFTREPVTGRTASVDFGPTPAAVQRQRLVAAEVALMADHLLDNRAHALLSVAWHVYSTNALSSYARVERLLDEIETILATPFVLERVA